MSRHGSSDKNDSESSLMCTSKQAIPECQVLTISNKLLIVSVQLIYMPMENLGECL